MDSPMDKIHPGPHHAPDDLTSTFHASHMMIFGLVG
jgi:hypothetical protein